MSQNSSPIDWDAIKSPVFLRGSQRIAYRDPTVHYHDGLFRAWFSLVDREPDGRCFWYTAVSRSADLIQWSEPVPITPTPVYPPAGSAQPLLPPLDSRR